MSDGRGERYTSMTSTTAGMKEPQSFKSLRTAYQVTRRHVPEKWIPRVRSDWVQHPPALLAGTYNILTTCTKWQAYATSLHLDLTQRTRALLPHSPYLRSFLRCLQRKGEILILLQISNNTSQNPWKESHELRR